MRKITRAAATQKAINPNKGNSMSNNCKPPRQRIVIGRGLEGNSQQEHMYASADHPGPKEILPQCKGSRFKIFKEPNK